MHLGNYLNDLRDKISGEVTASQLRVDNIRKQIASDRQRLKAAEAQLEQAKHSLLQVDEKVTPLVNSLIEADTPLPIPSRVTIEVDR